MGSVGFCGYSHRNPVGMGWGWVLKFHSHGNPGRYCVSNAYCSYHIITQTMNQSGTVTQHPWFSNTSELIWHDTTVSMVH